MAPPEVVKALEEKMINGETTRQELRDVWKAYRPAKEGKTERGRKPKSKTDSDSEGDTKTGLLPLSPSPLSPLSSTALVSPVPFASQVSPMPMPPVPSSALKSPPPAQSAKAVLAITAANIVTALRSPQWVIETLKFKKDVKEINHLRLFKEVAITVGSSHNARRIDVVAIVRETYKSPLPTVLGVEIKTSVNDLLRDMKLTEYMSFCHYFYLAIPNERAFIEAAESVTTQSIGLLTLTDKLIDGQYQLVVNRKARRLQPHPAILGELYGKCLFHALGWIGKEEEEEAEGIKS